MKRILITGAVGGMGYTAAKHFASLGYQVYALDIKNIEPLPNVTSFVVDMTKQEELENVYQKISKEGKLDAIIFLSGTYYMDSLIEIEEATLKRVFDINFFSVYLTNKVFKPLLEKDSRIIIITSEVAPLDPLPFNAIYSLSKSTLDKYAEALRQELNLLDIKVIIVRPGAVATGMLDASIKNIERIEKETKLYQDFAPKFKSIVVKNESKTIPTQKIADLIQKILDVKHPRLLYKINVNPKLKLLSALPKRWQLAIIKRLLKKDA